MANDIEIPTAQTEKSQPASAFPIVGIGASAGGLEAITALLSNMNPRCGMAFLVVQHLAPNHTSMLSGILAGKTAMPVIEATDNQFIERDHVYVIPPNTTMTVACGHLVLKQRDDSARPSMPIDELFYSLAEELGPVAIGISLSGSGSDGAFGIHAIKSEGGITFAQEESSARFNSMPHAAIETGCVDFVLTPKKIAVELARLGRHPFIASQPLLLNSERVATDEANLTKIFQILNRTYSIDFTHYKRGTLTRRLARRIALLNLSSLAEYLPFLEANAEEIHALHQDLLIRVTRFFRDSEAFEVLTEMVFPRLMETRSSDTPLRIWVPGCASGEEVYSIAICLLEHLGERTAQTPIQLFGTDVSESALAQARAGKYLENISNEVSDERLERFFVKADGNYQIAKSVRNLCVFAHQNVACDPPFSQLDLISCRNVLIYFDPVLQKRVISLFHYALKPGGFLILGPSETIGSSSDMFNLTYDKKVKVYTKRQVPSRSHLEYLDNSHRPALARQPADKTPSPEGNLNRHKREVDRIALARYVPAGVLCDETLNILEFRGDTGPYLAQPSGPPSTNLRQLTRPGLFVAISNMIAQARDESLPVRQTALRVEMAEGTGEVDLEVIPIPQEDIGSTWFLIFFENPGATKTPGAPYRSGNLWRRILSAIPFRTRGIEKTKYNSKEIIQHLKRELDLTRQHMRTMSDEHDAAQEELKASQEELLSSNEEFQSTNEELETAKEELQSSNEELTTTNDELRHSNDELQVLNVELARARNYAEAIVETVREPLIVLDHNLRVMRANAAFYQNFKLTPEQTKSSLFYELDNGQWDIPELRHLLNDVLPKQKSFHNYELTNLFPEIGMKTLLLDGTHLEWENQPLILLAIEDVTNYKLAQNALQDADRRKDEFLAMLAHELRSPLAPLRNALEIWRRGDAGEGAEKQAQAIMDRQLLKEARLIDDLLDVARITKGSIILTQEKVDLRQIANQAVESTRHQYEEFQHSLDIMLPEQAVIVEGDSVRLEQIVSNLLTNAAKYTDPGGRIILKLECRDKKAVLSVKDDGIGIPRKLLPEIFNLFTQANASLDRREGGLGIGLTLVRRLVDLHGGTIKAKSEGLKKGSEFIVTLPIVQGARPAVVTDKEPVVSRRILVVDDNIDTADTSAMLLKLEGHTAQIALDGPTAIETAREFRPEIILLDIGLPGMSGYEVARALRGQPQNRNALLVAITGYGQLDDREQSKGAGFDHHLTKPVDMDQLRAAIASYEPNGESKI